MRPKNPILKNASIVSVLLVLIPLVSVHPAAAYPACSNLGGGEFSVDALDDAAWEEFQWDLGLPEEPFTATVVGEATADLDPSVEGFDRDGAEESMEEVVSDIASDTVVGILTTSVEFAEGSTPTVDILMDVREVRNSRDYWSTWAKAELYDNDCNLLWESKVVVISVTDKWGSDQTGLYQTTIELADESFNIAEAVELHLAVGAKHCNKSWGWGGDYGCDEDLKDGTLEVIAV